MFGRAVRHRVASEPLKGLPVRWPSELLPKEGRDADDESAGYAKRQRLLEWLSVRIMAVGLNQARNRPASTAVDELRTRWDSCGTIRAHRLDAGPADHYTREIAWRPSAAIDDGRRSEDELLLC